MATKKRLGGSKNYLYFLERGAAKTNGSTEADTWYKIKAKAASNSGLPATSVVNDVIYSKGTSFTLVSGDELITMGKLTEDKRLAFVTDVPNSSSKDKFENTTQIDDVKSYVEGDKSEKTGTINGYFVVPDDVAEEILKRFARVVKYSGGVPTFNNTAVGVMDLFLGRNESAETGENKVIEYLPVIIDSLDMEKPMDGNQTFNFGYTAVGAERPSIHYIVM